MKTKDDFYAGFKKVETSDPFAKFKGKKFLIKEPHLHAGEIATFIDVEVLGVIHKPAMKFKGDYNEFFVFDNNEIQLID